MSDLQNRSFFHEGMRSFQDKNDGRRTAEAIEANRKHYDFWNDEKKWVSTTKFFFIASAWEEYVDCSIKCGDPGFIKIVDEGVIEYPEYDGNSMYRTLGNISKNPNVGLLFVFFDGKTRRIRINGTASVHQDKETLSRHFGAKYVVRIVCEIYPNCPRYIPNLLDGQSSKYVPRSNEGTPPAPEWKERDYIRNILPISDPHRQD